MPKRTPACYPPSMGGILILFAETGAQENLHREREGT